MGNVGKQRPRGFLLTLCIVAHTIFKHWIMKLTFSLSWSQISSKMRFLPYSNWFPIIPYSKWLPRMRARYQIDDRQYSKRLQLWSFEISKFTVTFLIFPMVRSRINRMPGVTPTWPTGRVFEIISSILVLSRWAGRRRRYGLGRGAAGPRGTTSAARVRAELHWPHGTGRSHIGRTGLLRVASQDVTIHMSAHAPPRRLRNRLGQLIGGADVPRYG